jgi:short-subunit dehydrogenase
MGVSYRRFVGLSLAGATVLLTGASAGIGAAVAPVLAGRGATLAVTGRRLARLDALVETLPGRGHVAIAADLASPGAPEDVVAAAVAAVGPLDVVVHNAGAPMRRHVTRLTLDDVDATLAVNTLAPVRMTLATLPSMVERGRGCQVYVSSLGGRLGIAGEAAYCASKFALAGFAEAVAIDLWDSPVDVRLVLPGPIDTEIWDRPGNDPAHYGGPFEPPSIVADAIADAIEGDAFEVYCPDLRGVVEWKTADPDAFLAGVAEMARRASP